MQLKNTTHSDKAFHLNFLGYAQKSEHLHLTKATIMFFEKLVNIPILFYVLT